MLKSNRELQKEQVRLYDIEKKLVNVLPIVKEALNSLKVEELHLKSLALQGIMEKDTLAQTKPSTIDIGCSNELINKQKMDLDVDSWAKLQLDEFEDESD
ncbi:uncharacterized protein LOC115624082 [Scaptodrosophila lebanonensis]|uniref:Uncharacterized protein LOC115624082 n=1 Tax=Drosophila lebanonensis TaxID=7225 RepID=A0A6J2THM0_DROLE|nr:uncharacterized protein LOC115624082 [Scaptodrosophila lebanonensis]